MGRMQASIRSRPAWLGITRSTSASNLLRIGWPTLASRRRPARSGAVSGEIRSRCRRGTLGDPRKSENPATAAAKSLPGQGNPRRVVLAPRHPAVRGVEAPLADNRPHRLTELRKNHISSHPCGGRVKNAICSRKLRTPSFRLVRPYILKLIPQMLGEYSSSVVSHANIYNWSRGANGGIFRAALPRLTLRMMSFADFVQTKGFGSALLCSM